MLNDAADMNIFRPYVRSLADCEQLTNIENKELIQRDWLARVVVQQDSGAKETHGKLYLKDTAQVHAR